MKKIINIILFVFLANVALAQTKVVRGLVVDDQGTPLYSTTIVEQENAKNVVLSDANGAFSIRVGLNSTSLIISSIGYVKKIVKISGEQMTIKLETDNSQLNEVLVVGFSPQKKITNSGAVSTVSGKELRQSPAASFQNALAGRLPGLFQQQTSGQPGGDAANIYIRGVATYAGGSNRPLVIVDDVEYPYDQLSQLSLNEVESATILKDASSTAIYGIKGANGVIVITTRRGTISAPKITLRSDFGIQSPTVRRKPLGTFDALTLLKEQAINQGLNPSTEYPGLVTDEALEHFRLGDSPYRYPSVNWYDEVMRKSALQQSNNFDIVGGTQSAKYFVSVGNIFQNGIMKNIEKEEDFNNNYYLKRYNVRANLDLNVTKSLLVKVDLSARFNEVNSPNFPDVVSGGAWPIWRRLSSGLLTPWVYPVKQADGSYGGRPAGTLNPVGILQYAGYNREYSNNLNLNLKAQQNLDFVTKGLAARATIGFTNNMAFTRSLTRDNFPTYTLSALSDALDPVAPGLSRMPILATGSAYISPLRRLTTQGILDYNRQFGDHNVFALVVYNRTVDKAGDPNNRNSTTELVPGKFQGYSARIGYNYKSKYMIELNGARNGTDRFQALKRFGFFPAASIGWNISDERFFKKALPFINYMKFRGSYGLVGSDDFGSSLRYLYQEVYNSSGTYYFGDSNTSVAGLVPGALGNNDVRWEKEKKLNIGTDIKMFNNTLSATFDYFFNNRFDILTTRETIPGFAGITLPPVNLGIVHNRGFELELGYQNTINDNTSYFVKGNVSYVKNKIVYRDEPYNLGNPLIMKTGRPIGQLYGYTFTGFYDSDEDIANSPKDVNRIVKPGDLKYQDINNDGQINQGDIGPIGNPNIPLINYGFSLGFSYKKIDISMLFQGAAKGSMSASTMLQTGNLNAVPSEIHLKRWTPETKNDAEFPRLGGPNFDMSTFWLRPTDYIRLKNVELGYTFNEKLVKKIGLNNVRVYANAMNLVTWFGLKIYDVDPESLNATGTSEAYSSYPQQKIVNFGLSVGF